MTRATPGGKRVTKQNRVDPLGRIGAFEFRGAFMGNRGILHDDEGRIVRDQRTNAWITCVLSFKGRRRELLQPGQYTELFFWDEATALAAGHRPCFECRREDAIRFRDLFRRVTPDRAAGAGVIDTRLATERRRPRYGNGSGHLLVLTRPETLPSGAMVLVEDRPCLVDDGTVRPWSTSGYGPPRPLPDHEVPLVTPVTTTRILAAGYEPQIVGVGPAPARSRS